MSQSLTQEDLFSVLNKYEKRIERLEAAAQPEAVHWIGATGEIPFQNGWVHYDTVSGTPNLTSPAYRNAGYYRHGGRVFLMGVIRNGTLGQPCFTLPVGFQPIHDGALHPSVANGLFAYLTTNSNGTIVPGGSNAWVTLDGISFRVK